MCVLQPLRMHHASKVVASSGLLFDRTIQSPNALSHARAEVGNIKGL